MQYSRSGLHCNLGGGGALAQDSKVLPFISDPTTGHTNEVVLRLNYKSPQALALLAPPLDASLDEAPAEAQAIRTMNLQQSPLLRSISARASAGFLITEGRMDDVARATHERRRSSGAIPADADDPQLRLNQYIVVRTSGLAEAKALVEQLRRTGIAQYAEVNQVMGLSATPSDSFFSSVTPISPVLYQWGMHALKFPLAWDVTKGHANVGVLDAGWPGVATAGGAFTPHPDLANSFRPGMVGLTYGPTLPAATTANHTVHVTGIIGAQHNNGHGVAGGCPNCSVVPYPYAVTNSSTSGQLTVARIAERLVAAVDGGMQVINWSGGSQGNSLACTGERVPLCDALGWAKLREVLVVVSAGNDRNTVTKPVGTPQFPGNLGDNYPVLPVGGIDSTGARWNTGLLGDFCGPSTLLSEACQLGTNDPSPLGVMAPAKLIVSTFNAGEQFSPAAQNDCSDDPPLDKSHSRYGYDDDGYGTCTGTSMAAPFITSGAALVRSVYPRASIDQVRTRLRQSGFPGGAPTAQWGYGIVNVSAAVNSTVSQHNPYRLTPLYAYYSTARVDSFYTTKPQAATAAVAGTLWPRVAGTTSATNQYNLTYGNVTTGPEIPPVSLFVTGPGDTSRAEVWLFTTQLNPANASVALTPLVRMSRRCGDKLPKPAVCTTNTSHVDTLLVAESEISSYFTNGYRVDGIEGYAYPRNSQVQPAGTVRLLKRYHAARDDHAVFPESRLSAMVAQGYTTISGLDWLGYVYPNPVSGIMPTY